MATTATSPSITDQFKALTESIATELTCKNPDGWAIEKSYFATVPELIVTYPFWYGFIYNL